MGQGKYARNRPDKDGTFRAAFDKNKKTIYATQTICAICGKPVDFSLKFPDPMSPTSTTLFLYQRADIHLIYRTCSLHIYRAIVASQTK